MATQIKSNWTQRLVVERKFVVRTSLAFLGLAWFATSIAVSTSRVHQLLPTSVDSTPPPGGSSDVVTSSEFNTWFKSGTATLNGVVNPADSLNFTNNPNGDFYKWSWQMFLWVTSPAPPTYGGGAHIFDSSTFFDVSTESNGSRTLLAHPTERRLMRGQKLLVPNLALRAAQVGQHGLPTVISKTHVLLEVVPAPSPVRLKLKSVLRGRPLQVARDRRGRPVSAATIKIVNKKVQFFGANGKRILGAKTFFPLNFQTSHFITPLHIGGGIVFVDPFNNVIDTELGQAQTNGVLMSQSGSLIYYRSMVNDVYAYFLTGMKDGHIPGIAFPANGANEISVNGSLTFIFPTQQSQLNQVTAFAAAQNPSVTFADPNALCIEIKSSWIDASKLSNPSDYITSSATVPTYNTSNPNSWLANGSKTITVALVGIHIVGSTAGHPEMVWATFEHFGNSPNPGYPFLNGSGHLVNQPADSVTGPWLFCSPTHSGSFNQPHMTDNVALTANITSVSPFSISASDTQRGTPFGSSATVSPNPFDSSAAASNSEILTADNSVLGLLVSGDVRKNYFLEGATWTENGEAPAGNFPSGNCVGTSLMANSTMETYTVPSNCFDCHGSASQQVPTTDVSHLFPQIKKMF